MVGEPAELLGYLTLGGLSIGERAGPSPAFTCVLINMSFTAKLVGLNRASDWYATRAYKMAGTEGQGSASAYVPSIDALGQAQHGRWQAALEANARAIARINEIGDPTLANEAASVRSTLTMTCGDLTGADEIVEDACRFARLGNNRQFLCWAPLDIGALALAQDNLERAKHLDRTAIAHG